MCFLATCVWDSHSGMEALCRLFPIRRDWKAELKKPSPGPLVRDNNHDHQNNAGDVICELSRDHTLSVIQQSDSPFVQHNKVDGKYCNIEEERKQDEPENTSQEVLCNVDLET